MMSVKITAPPAPAVAGVLAHARSARPRAEQSRSAGDDPRSQEPRDVRDRRDHGFRPGAASTFRRAASVELAGFALESFEGSPAPSGCLPFCPGGDRHRRGRNNRTTPAD